MSLACSVRKREMKGGPSCNLHKPTDVRKEDKVKLFSAVHSKRTSGDNHRLQ